MGRLSTLLIGVTAATLAVVVSHLGVFFPAKSFPTDR